MIYANTIGKFENRISKFEANPKSECSNDKNNTIFAMADMPIH
jgi:hypothetical protein